MSKYPRTVEVARFAFVMALLAAVAGCGQSPPSIVERIALKGHSREVTSLAFSPEGSTLASRGADGIKVWDVRTGAKSATLPSDGMDFGTVAYSPDGKALASDRVGAGAVAWDLATGRERARFEFLASKPDQPGRSTTRGWGLAFSPDGRTIAGGGSHGGEDGFVSLWDSSGGRGVELSPLRRPITTVAFSPDGKTIASGSMDGKLVLWDAIGRRQRLQIEANRSYLAPVCFSPDGRLVASANEARWVKLWNAADGREVASLKGHIKAVLSLAFSPDGGTLVSGDSGGILFVWDVSSRRMLTRIERPDRGKVWGLAFSPDGETLASAGEDRSVHLWDVTWPDSTANPAR